MTAKKENIDLILRKILIRPRSWSELMEIIDVSEATLSRYLKELREKNLVEKSFDERDNIVYSPNVVKLLTENKLDIDFLERSKETNRLLSELEDLGLFDSGMDQEDILKFMKDNADSELIDIPEDAVKDKKHLDVDLWKHFSDSLSTFLVNSFAAKVKTDLKIESDPNDFRIDLENIKEDIEE